MRQAGRMFLEKGGLSMGRHVMREQFHATEKQEIGCFEGNRGRKLTGRETSEGEERKKGEEEMK